MLLSHEMRCAGCSVVALLMMSIPGLGNHPFGPSPQMSLEAPHPVAPVTVTPVVKKKRFSFLRPPMVGLASWYGAVRDGHKTASGETFDMTQMTACHRSLPFGTMVRVVDLRSHKSVIVRINDRGVLFADRIIDLSRGAAERLGMRSSGVANVRVDVLTKQQAETEMAAMRTSEVPATVNQ